MITLGIPKEVKPLEKRVGLIPSAVKILTEKGIKVLVEKNAGVGSGFPDSDYEKNGAEIVPDAASVYGQAGLIQKIKEPQSSEFNLLRKDQILFCFLHLASPDQCKLVQALVSAGTLAIGYETFEVDGKLPLLAPMSEIAGGLASAYGAFFQAFPPPFSSPRKTGGGEEGGKEKLAAQLEKIASQYPHFDKTFKIGKVVIFGGGVAGFKAMEIALELGGSVTMIEMNPERANFLKKFTPSVLNPREDLTKALEAADVIIGCVHSRGQRAQLILDAETLKKVSAAKKKVLMDVSIDQGGNFPESHSTTYLDPVYRDSFGNLRFCVSNIPSLCGLAASKAISEISLPYTTALAKNPQQAFQSFPELKKAINVHSGKVLIPAILEAHQSNGK